MGALDRADRVQRRHPVIGFPVAVIYKFIDDQGNILAGALSYYAFVAIFPLLLLASSILGFILHGNTNLQQEVLDSAVGQFPIVGEQLSRPEGLSGSVGAVIVGTLVALYGAIGLGQGIQNMLNVAWAIPRNSRPNPIKSRLKSLVLLASSGLAVLAISVISVLASNRDSAFGVGVSRGVHLLIQLVTVLVVGGALTLLFRLATARRHVLRASAPGGFTVAVLWQVLQYVGYIYVDHVLRGPSQLNKTFGFVLGLMALLYLASMIAIIGVEVNVVVALKLFPRALLTPFTDSVDLTEADRRSYAMLAQAQRLKGFETVSVRFDGRDGGTHEIVLNPDDEQTGTGEIGLRHPKDAKKWGALWTGSHRTVSRSTDDPETQANGRRRRVAGEKPTAPHTANGSSAAPPPPPASPPPSSAGDPAARSAPGR